MSESPSPQGEGLRGLAPLREEGKLVAHRVKIPALLSFQAAALRSATPTPHDKA